MPTRIMSLAFRTCATAGAADIADAVRPDAVRPDAVRKDLRFILPIILPHPFHRRPDVTAA